jgi:hypothetical protein
LLVIGIPAGFENFFKELGNQVADELNFTPPSDPYAIDKIIDISKFCFSPLPKHFSSFAISFYIVRIWHLEM